MTWKERMSGCVAGIIKRLTLRAPDRRKFPRFEAKVPLVINVVKDEEISTVRALADGISLGGFSAAGLEGLAEGQGISLEIQLPIATQPMWVEAIVRHSNGCYGVEFVSLSEAQQRLIKRYCRLQPRQKRHSA